MSLGVAIDLGTTHITVAICDRTSGHRLGVRSGPNPQGSHCADIIGRLRSAAESRDTAEALRDLAIEAIGGALLDLSRQEGIPLPLVGQVRVVGNSAMLTILSGQFSAELLDPAHWQEAVTCEVKDGARLAEAWNLGHGTDIQVVQPIGGFVGSDLLVGAIHCRMTAEREPTLLIDFGTNTEIALWDGERLWATAAAGGPAFEGAGIGCGRGAEPGAIHRLTRGEDRLWRIEVLDTGPAQGICGSGLVDALAILRAGGEIDVCGRPAQEPLIIAVDDVSFGISKADIDQLQQAKAGIAAGVAVLCRRAGLAFGQIAAVHVAGSFGEHLDIANSIQIGLLPPIPADRVILAGNTALHGALDLILSSHAEAALQRARKSTTLINLTMDEEFDELFFENLYIRAMAEKN